MVEKKLIYGTSHQPLEPESFLMATRSQANRNTWDTWIIFPSTVKMVFVPAFFRTSFSHRTDFFFTPWPFATSWFTFYKKPFSRCLCVFPPHDTWITLAWPYSVSPSVRPSVSLSHTAFDSQSLVIPPPTATTTEVPARDGWHSLRLRGGEKTRQPSRPQRLSVQGKTGYDSFQWKKRRNMLSIILYRCHVCTRDIYF